MRKEVALCLALALTGCGDDLGFEYSDYHCGLGINNATLNDATLASAMNAQSPGVFCTISYKYSGTYYYVFESNQSQSSEKVFTALDLKSGNHQRIGMNNGLIVGFGNLSSPATFYAFDQECPVCFDYNALPVKSYKLSVSSAGIATCSNCHRSFNLNTGGFCTNGSGHLTRYRARTGGPYQTLVVN